MRGIAIAKTLIHIRNQTTHAIRKANTGTIGHQSNNDYDDQH